MNRYMAVCHALALLDTPIDAQAFAAGVQNNPLFATGCITPAGCLQWLSEEGLLLQEGEAFRLGPEGRILQQHVLGWSARDQVAVRQQNLEYRAASGAAPLQPDCPVCGSGLCAHYLLAVLLERLYAGLESHNRWPPAEIALLADVLESRYAGVPALYLLDETLPLSALAPEAAAELERLCAAEFGHLPELAERFLERAQRRRLLPELSLERPFVRVPRLRFGQGLLPAPQLQELRRLAYPGLFGSADPDRLFLRLGGIAVSGQDGLMLLVSPEHSRLLLAQKTKAGWRVAEAFELPA